MQTKSPCMTCGSATYSYWRKIYPLAKSGDVPYEECNECTELKRPRTSYDDIYTGDCHNGTTTDPNLCDPDTGKEIPYGSPKEKAAVMKRLNVAQHPGAERHHGAMREHTVRRTYFHG